MVKNLALIVMFGLLVGMLVKDYRERKDRIEACHGMAGIANFSWSRVPNTDDGVSIAVHDWHARDWICEGILYGGDPAKEYWYY